MRITNTMMMNSTLRNVNKSKNNLSDIENQMSSEKKITRPSDDPIIAIRALSLRSSLNEIDMYLNTNVPSAEAWLKVTQTALDNSDGILQDIYKYCTQGASDEFTVDDRSAIIDVLKQYKDAVYSELNAANAGRYCFTGFKTDTAFTFLTDTDAAKKYEITQKFTPNDISTANVMLNSVNIDTISQIDAADTPETKQIYRLRLAYNDCMATGNSTLSITSTANDGTQSTTDCNVECVSQNELTELIENGTFAGASNKVYYVYDTGELAVPDSMYDTVKNSDDMSFTYQKDGFKQYDPRPEMYFTCKDITDPADVIEYTYEEGGQNISFTVNFSQNLQVNTLGCNTLSYDIGRDIDDMCAALQSVKDIETNISKLKQMQESNIYSDSDKDKIKTMLDAANKEKDYAIESMKKLFSNGMTKVTGYQEKVDIQIADLGARSARLTLTKSRLTEQYATFKDLKSSNEDVELEDTVIKYSSAQTLYEAALTAASKTVKQSLLDYI